MDPTAGRPGRADPGDTGDLGATGALVSDQGWLVGGRYRVVDRLGIGGMADVFRAHDELLARDVALKVFRAMPVTPDTASGVERQRIELHALARLNHRNLITLFDGSIAEGEGPAYLVMELIEGPTLSARIADSAMTESAVRELGIQIADALAYVHGEGMVHRDVKPANILLGSEVTDGTFTMHARLSDFGIVRLLGSERLTSVDFTLGTASYLAPEQARGSDVGPTADVYSLGLVMIEALTGVRSFDGAPLEAVMARLARDPEIPTDLPPPWPALLASMCARDPAARPTAAQVSRILRDSHAEGATPPIVAASVAAGSAAAASVAESAALADASTAGIPAAAEPLAAFIQEPAVADRGKRRHVLGWLAAAAVAVIAAGIAGILLLRPASSSADHSPPVPSTTIPKPGPTTSGQHASTGAAAVKGSATAPLVVRL